MIWIALPILALLILISRLQKPKPISGGSGGAQRTGGNEVDLKAMIDEANKIAGWKTLEEAINEYGKFLGVYKKEGGNIPRTTMTLDEFAQIVKKTVDKKVIAQSIIAIAIREQGASRGLSFPDNNPFGFNAFKCRSDMCVWKDVLHLINGIFLAKDQNGWRWFIGFPSLENAIRAMEISLRKKGFDKIQSPEEFVYLYVRKWWSPTKDENKLQEIIQKEMRNLIAVWRQAGKYVG
jgi:hypothetical protein